MKSRLAAAAVLVVLAAGGAALVLHRQRAVRDLPPPAATPRPVRTAALRTGTVAEELRTVALIQAGTTTVVAAQVPGALLEVLRREGDAVQAGQLLARIDPRTLEDAAEAARARRAAAEEELRRQEAVAARDERLFAGAAISRQAVDASRAQLEAARAAAVGAARALESARTARAFADVVAPHAGVVASRLVEPGDLAAPGRPLFALQVARPARLLSRLSQGDLAAIAPGAPVTFTVGAREVAGRVARIYPALDAARLGSVETVFPEAPFGLPPGAVIAARYQGRAATGLVAPALALLDGLDETLVVRVRDGRAEPVAVEVLARNEREAVVRGALASGDLVVTGLPSELVSLTAGTPLRPVAAPPAGGPALRAASGERP